MRLFYDPHITTSDTSYIMSEEESRHVVRVLRMSEGDQLQLVNGKGARFNAKIIQAHPKKCQLAILSFEEFSKPEYDIHIAICPTKQTDRTEWFIEKATEIGVTEITFLTTSNSERIRLKSDRLIKKAVSAMKQSQRVFLPKIHDLTNFTDFIAAHPEGVLAHCYDTEKKPLSTSFSKTNCPILIGPEGDFTLAEVETALQKGYKSITLGENRLRTETAGLYACVCAKLLIDQR